ncbi:MULTISPECIES: class I SAM-dependent methyltransferase [unclassified Mesorhizobium]|uniref:class I SAM-dependent methyltransferase n=1 Tax=unclassified Mesorhizobium TaxID=325217 RepID=UPI000FC9FC63|nr:MULTISPECIES: class I SAM-dependent methyltransferase [unclassified Mesorhizobium]RUX94944.1 class I SAM-dependent methyltransferase [Mesorhizobium sp. M7D.F.Ca.US.004.01.2.1]RVA35906.1 class I SAM-dependent methyltransferase [Mesorhizobium sp. M7D.F.Ca.US.004.03.1.1]
MLEAEFDQFAREYHEQHAASIRLSGETPDFFARYKIDDVATTLRRAGVKPRRILDFGAGVGNSLGHMRSAFPDAEITLLDPSRESLDIASNRFPGQAAFTHFDGKTIPFAAGSFDLAFAACVFHHIPEDLQVGLLAEIGRVLADGGSFFLFEHNPWNPLTTHAVRNCAFDENAVLINSREMRRRMAEAGLANTRIIYRIFFPRLLARLRPFERFLTKIPVGAQYFAHAVKPAV